MNTNTHKSNVGLSKLDSPLHRLSEEPKPFRANTSVLRFLFVCISVCFSFNGLGVIGRASAAALRPIPEKLVVLTFDDSVRSHFDVARPILKKHGFGATFFITEGWDFRTNKQHYLSWEQIAQLHRDGFEIGNHTRDHLAIRDKTVPQLDEQLAGIEAQCKEHGIPSPVTFAWPGNAITTNAFSILRQHGILFARRGGAPEFPYEFGRGIAMEPGQDHPLLLPSAGDARPFWELPDFVRAVSQAKVGRPAILQFHGVPDIAHPWVSSLKEKFATYMQYLADNNYRVIALRDLARYVSPDTEPADPMAIIESRKKRLENEKP